MGEGAPGVHWLNIGCGDKQIPGERWTNVDSRAMDGIGIVTDMGDLGMLNDNTIELIYACHVLEHVRRDHALATLREWARVLIPQTGILRVCVPDMGFIAQALAHGTHLGRLRGLIWGGQNYPENTHYTGWDYEELARDLRECGFFNVARYDTWKAMQPWVPPRFRDFSFMELDGQPCSLNVEAVAK